MGSIQKKSSPQVTLIPWDPDSPQHVQRMFDQRIACGWNSLLVETWRQLQREGKCAMHWITLSDSDPEKEVRLAAHLSASPSESSPIQDTATSLRGASVTPTSALFIPIGHISLDSWNEDPSLASAAAGIYRIEAFYVSAALQGTGLGGAVMDEIERVAVSPPLNARQLTLRTLANAYPNKEEARIAMGWEKEKFSKEDWYARRGFEAYRYQEGAWATADPTGKEWPASAVYMRKNIK